MFIFTFSDHESPTFSLSLENEVSTANLTHNSIENFQIDENEDPKSLLQKLRDKNRDRPIIGYVMF